MKIARCTFATAVMIDGATHLSANAKNSKSITYDPQMMIYEIVGATLGNKTWVHSTNVQYSIPDEQQEARATRGARTTKEA